MSTDIVDLRDPHALGIARIEAAATARSAEDWERLWQQPAFPYPFSWGDCWNQCTEYAVADFPAEVGFFTDILGLAVNALGPAYAMFTSPDRAFFFAVTPAIDRPATHPEAIRLQFMIEGITEAGHELERRGIIFEKGIHGEPNSSLLSGTFRTPNGIAIDLWGMTTNDEAPSPVEADSVQSS